MKIKHNLYLLAVVLVFNSCANSTDSTDTKWQTFWATFQKGVTNEDAATIKSLCFWNVQFTEESFDENFDELISDELKDFVAKTQAGDFPPAPEQPFEILDFANNTSYPFENYRELVYNTTAKTNECLAYMGMRDGEYYIPMWFIKK